MRFLSPIPKAEFVTVTKELVEELLARNVGNRRLRNSHVNFLAAQFKSGAHVVTNNGVGIDTDGIVFDGQHTLTAFKESGYPAVSLLIVYGLPKEARAVVDQGIKRTMADIFHFAFDMPEATAQMIAITRFWGLQVNNHWQRKPSSQEMVEWYMTLEPTFHDLLSVPGALRLPSPIMAAICSVRLRNMTDTRCVVFLEKLLSGAGLESGSPILALRNWIESKRGSQGGSDIQIERFDKTIAALNAYLEDRSLSKLYANKGRKARAPSPRLNATH